MRMMMVIQMPTEPGNAAMANGRFAPTMAALMDRIKPEGAYFTTVDSHRGGYIFFDLQDPSDIPSICEPLFAELGAKLELMPVMTPADLQSGLAKAAH